MNIYNRFAIMFAFCAFFGFVQNASAENTRVENSQSNSEDDAVVDDNKKNFKSKGDDFVDNLMEKIPYSQSLKYTWKVVDGDVDLYFAGLRVDRRNKGIKYSIDSLPMVGTLHGAELNAAFGEDSKLTFTSDYMPLVGRVDGLQFKAAAGTGDSNISLRYKTNISW